jgi:hypothetical protein
MIVELLLAILSAVFTGALLAIGAYTAFVMFMWLYKIGQAVARVHRRMWRLPQPRQRKGPW